MLVEGDPTAVDAVGDVAVPAAVVDEVVRVHVVDGPDVDGAAGVINADEVVRCAEVFG